MTRLNEKKRQKLNELFYRLIKKFTKKNFEIVAIILFFFFRNSFRRRSRSTFR